MQHKSNYGVPTEPSSIKDFRCTSHGRRGCEECGTVMQRCACGRPAGHTTNTGPYCGVRPAQGCGGCGQLVKVVRSCENPWHGTAPARAMDLAPCPECVVRCAEHGELVAGFRGLLVHVDGEGAPLRTMEPFCGPHYRPSRR